jgi:hypothetical protein
MLPNIGTIAWICSILRHNHHVFNLFVLMSKPYIHACSSARKFGGKPEDYMDIHNLMDSSKAAMADNRHRALTHNTWFVNVIIERIFGSTMVNSDGKTISVRDVAEQHILEDYGGKFIPTAQDFLQEINYQNWMNAKGVPPSAASLQQNTITSFIAFNHD